MRGRDEGEERRTFSRALAALEAFGAPITLRRPGWAWIATRGPARYFGGEEAFGRSVAQALRSLGGPWEGGDGLIGGCFGVGIGDGVFVATRAAERGEVVPHRSTVDFLARLPVEAFGRPGFAALLRNLGIGTLGEFASLDGAEVLARFGWEGSVAHEIARGHEHVAHVTASPRIDGEIATEIEPPAVLVEEVVFASRRLATELCERVRSHGRAFSLLCVTVETEGGDRSTRRWSHDGPFSAPLVVERVRWQMDGWMAPQQSDEASHLLGGVVLLRLGAEEIVPDSGRQPGLWDRATSSEDRVVQSFARVQGMLGPEGVLQGSIVGGRDPRERIELRPFGDRRPRASRPADRPWPGQIPPPSPVIVFDPPLQVAVRDLKGEPVVVDGRGGLSGDPMTIEVAGAIRPVTSWAGPWPVDERWWEVGRRRRARFQLVSDEEVYLVALERGRGLLEGRYD
jgi:protein ImuB